MQPVFSQCRAGIQLPLRPTVSRRGRITASLQRETGGNTNTTLSEVTRTGLVPQQTGRCEFNLVIGPVSTSTTLGYLFCLAGSPPGISLADGALLRPASSLAVPPSHQECGLSQDLKYPLVTPSRPQPSSPPFPSFSSIHLVRYNTQLLHLLGDKAAIVVIPSLSRLVDPLAYTSAFPYAPVDIHSLTSTRLRTAPNVYRRSSDHLNQVHTPTRPCPTSSLVSRQNLDYQFWYAFLVGN